MCFARPVTLNRHKIRMDVSTKSDYYEKKYEFVYQNSFLYRNLYQLQSKRNLNSESGHLNFIKFEERSLHNSDKI